MVIYNVKSTAVATVSFLLLSSWDLLLENSYATDVQLSASGVYLSISCEQSSVSCGYIFRGIV